MALVGQLFALFTLID